jgi:hypothetical protein
VPPHNESRHAQDDHDGGHNPRHGHSPPCFLRRRPPSQRRRRRLDLCR